jgi:hypothetical protein
MDFSDIVQMIFVYFVETAERIDPLVWNGIHPPEWETTEDYSAARVYAGQVIADFPQYHVRIVERDPSGALPDVHIQITR